MNKEDQAKDKANIVWHEHTVSREVREQRQGHRGCVVWFTGLSGSGKSTVANLVDEQLFAAGIRSYVLDGDNVRHGLNAGPESLRERHSEIFAARFGLDVCETRDPKGLYKKARAGLIKDFTGIQAPYESPSSPEIHLDATSAPDQLAEQVIQYLQRTDKIGPS
jgi:adenylylsulfate kinase